MQRLVFISLSIALIAVCALAKDQPARERGVLAEMQSVSCGYMQKSGSTVAGVLITGAQHTKSRELLCQEYVLKTDRVTYRIRPLEEKHPVLLRVGDEAEFRLKKDKMLLRVPESDNKEREYAVISMTASPELTTAIEGTKRPPKPHGAKLDGNVTPNGAASESANPHPAASGNGAAPTDVSPSDEAREGTLRVVSTPSGAEVFVDSASAGRTPAVISVKPGQHSVQVAMPGYQDWVGGVVAVAGGEQTVTASMTQQKSRAEARDPASTSK